MSHRIAAKGYTSVVLVLNMKRFVAGAEARKRFETVRGSLEFAEALQQEWPQSFSQPARFSPINGSHMTVEDVGFATGVFRSLLLDRHSSPTYALDKEKVTFSPGLESNFQFKTLFKRAWDRWEISIRPTMTGFFIIRLVYRYQQAPRAIIDLAKDAIKLQEPLDVPSAVRWLKYNRERYENEPDKLAEKERSVKELLEWLGADVENPHESETMYYPVQWKLAVEAINLFVQDGRFTIPHKDGAIKLRPYPPRRSLPLHDSYIIYHFDELLAEPGVIDKAKRGTAKSGTKVCISLNKIRQSNQLRNAIVSLLEGTVLRDPDKPDEELDANGYFPSPRWSHADALFDDQTTNLASWSDELCLFSGRTALIMPSKKWRDYEMAVSTVPSATLKVQYARYWEAIERMIEFVLEVRVLVQLIESDSYRLLSQIANTIEEIRADMFNGDIVIEGELKEQMAQAAHLRRMAALAQSISHPPFWSRAEYAVQKAERLFSLLDVPRILEHVERNIESINSVADHVDELYIADLSEKSNDKATVLSLGLAAVSFIVTLLALPSFWYDLAEFNKDWWRQDLWYTIVFNVGTFLGLSVVVAAIALSVLALRRRDTRRMMRHLVNRNR
ncbi:MAG: hypothetical protein H6654_13370 [Ardenticatenaceae bacterium]|nr:hypothetical protein [Anaerolineales bacterium]MCB8941563.1 hypothetical protein [Ardenticatenaceae bacterium]MCB8974543.1 hypothetical protein [Ardenticatenaceae bacterium]